MTTIASKMEDFLRLSLNNKNIFVSDVRAKNEGEYEYAIFFNQRNHSDYVSNKCDSENLIIWQTERGQFGFSYFVEDKCDFVEYKETFNSILICIKKVAEFYFEGLVNQAVIDFNEN
jgi:hypothetical protein